MTNEECIKETKKHIEQVKSRMLHIMNDLDKRAFSHDASKLKSCEIDGFAEYTPKLRASTYGSGEYKRFLAEMKPFLDHHYLVNRHHPEHFDKGIKDMTLVDMIEMLCDWKAATLRHANGDILKSIEVNQKRFGYSDDIKQLLINTIEYYFL